MQIPRKIYSTCSTAHWRVRQIREERKALLERNKDWSHNCLTDKECEEFISREYSGETYLAWSLINPAYGAAKADFLRYCLMYKYGGLYLDIKSTCRRPLSEVIKDRDQYLLSQWDNKAGDRHQGWGLHDKLQYCEGGEFQQWFIACIPAHPFLDRVIERITHNILNFPESVTHHFGRMGVLETTGPIPYTHAIYDCLNNASQHTEKSYRRIGAVEEGLVYSIFESDQYLSRRDNLAGTTHADTHLNQAYMANHYSRLSEPVVLWEGRQT